MTNTFRIVLAALLLSPAIAQAAQPAYRVVKEVPLGMPDKWDFVYFDANRIYVSHATEVTVVDGASYAVAGRIPGFDTSHGIVTVPELGRGYADSGNAKTVIVFDLKTLKPLTTLPVGEDADAMAYDPKTKRVFVMDADGATLSTIDAVNNKALPDVPLGGKPESAVTDGAGKLYINLASTGELIRVDAAALKIEARWPLSGCTSPHGLAMDQATHRLFVSCENEVMQVVSSDDGKVVATLPIGKGTDAAAFDPGRKLAFSSNGDGTLSIVAEKGPDTFVALPPATTLPGARTMAVDAATGRIFLVTGTANGTEPRPGRAPRIRFVPGSLKLIVLEPAN